ncbi:DUF4194 domain-containing protein [Nocardioides insulae]|uniref:DUF4194 domain-containing protein n=1 Tax=Nocardioides insulae TaxID=394734 RepID=UPI00042A67E0|nr:DUF4194 domain-containing protein [Nocardioides insulae]
MTSLDAGVDRDLDEGLAPGSTDDRPYDDETDLDAGTVSLWEGDEGTLDLAQRRALLVLVKQRFISGRTHPREWQTLIAHRTLLTGRLNDLFLDLHVDPVREVAWKRQATGEAGQRFPTLLHDTAWTREETAVLVFLRDRFRAGTTAGEDRVFVDREDIVSYIADFRPAHATDVSGDERRARNAVLAVNRMGLLIGTAGEERFEISEAIESLLPLETLRELLTALRTATSSAPEMPEADLFETEERA